MPCAAQDLEATVVDDFISPSELKTDAGLSSAFFVSRAFVGVDYDFTQRNELYDQNVGFVELVNNFYYSRVQLNVNLTRFAVNPSSLRVLSGFQQPAGQIRTGNNMQGVPLSRLGVEGSIYGNGTQDSGSRVTLAWRALQLMSGSHEQEFGATYEYKLQLPKDLGEKLFGGVSYAYRPAQGRQSFNFGYQFTPWADDRGRSVSGGLALGFEIVQGDWRGGAARAQLGFTTPVLIQPLFLHLVYSYAGLQTNRIGLNQLEDKSHEFAVFLSVPVFSKITSPKKP